jgi:hypothetical protein
MPLTGRPDVDIPELIDRCRRSGKFGTLKRSSFEVCRRRAIAAAMSEERRNASMAKKRPKRHTKNRG